MSTGKKILHWLAIIIAVLAIVLSAAGIVGTWWAQNAATNATLKAFSAVDTSVGVVNAGASRVNDLVERSRAEVQQVESTIVSIGANVEDNSPLLTAVSNRVSERLTPAVEQVRSVLSPVVSAVQSVRALVDFVNAIPFIRETPPAVDNLETALNRIDETVADVRQVNDTIKTTVIQGKNRLTGETVDSLTSITDRVDSRLASVQTEVQAAQAELVALQGRLEARKSQLLLIYNLSAVVLTLFLVWVIYSEIVVLRSHWSRLRAGRAGAQQTALAPAAPVETVAAPPQEPSEG